MRKLILALFFIGMFTSSEAQVGFRGGLNFSNLGGDVFLIDNERTLGFNVGLVYGFSLTNNLEFRPGLLYSTKGFNSTEAIDINDQTRVPTTNNINYLEIPLDFKYKFRSEASGFFIYGGPYVGLLLSANQKKLNQSVDFNNNLKSLDFGLNLGFGYDLNSNCSIGLGYGLGISSITQEDGSITNRNISSYFIYSL